MSWTTGAATHAGGAQVNRGLQVRHMSIVSGKNLSGALLAALLALLLVVAGAAGARAQQDGRKLFTVSGIAVDVQAEDASQAKVRAILLAQRRAFFQLVKRLSGERVANSLQKLTDRQIGRLMSSLSISDERTGANRYIATLAVRFNPRKVIRLLRNRGVPVVTVQAPPVLIIPVWEDLDGIRIFEDNPWLRAWRQVADEHALQPVIVPAGDDVDMQAAADRVAIRDDLPGALDAFRLRYGVDHVLVAHARPLGEGRVHAAMIGKAPGGKVAFDKEYAVPEKEKEQAGAEQDETPWDAAALRAATRFMDVLAEKWRKKQIGKALAAARERAEREAARRRAASAASLTIIVPFSSLREWQTLRARLRTNPAIAALDVRALSGNHAVVRVRSRVPAEQLRDELAASRLDLFASNGRWYLRSY